MKRALTMLPVMALVLTFGLGAEAKHSKAEMKAFERECKSENPTFKKKALKKCAKAKAKAGAHS